MRVNRQERIIILGSLQKSVWTFFPSLRHRNFRLFWLGQCVSLVGTWMQNIGLSWLVFKLTGSSLLLGAVNAAQFLPILLFSLFMGPLVDRFPKKPILLVTQSAMLVLASALAVITATGHADYRIILIFAFTLGLVNTIDIPTRQSFMIELVGREDLMNAISLNSAAFNVSRIAGPAVAGMLIAYIGIAPCFLINAVSFLGVIIALIFIDAPRIQAAELPKGRFSGILPSIGEGLSYIVKTPSLFLPMLLLALTSTFVINYQTVIPVFAVQTLGGDAIHFGFLMTSMGIGSLLGALTLASRSQKGPRILILLSGAMGMSVFFGVCGLQSNYALSCLLLGLTGFFTIAFATTCNAQVQINSADHMRGRVMSVYSLVFGGVTPIGSLYAGKLIDIAGTGFCMVFSGIIGILSTAVIGGMIVHQHKIVYKKGILI